MTENDEINGIFIYEMVRTGDWWIVLIKDPNLFFNSINAVEGYYNEGTSQTFGPFDDREEAVEKARALTSLECAADAE